MKRKIASKLASTVMAAALCCSLIGCTTTPPTTPSESTAPQSASITEASTKPIGSLDYSQHTDPNEELYVTKLADLSKLQKGEPSIALKEAVGDMSWRKFEGWVKNENFGYDVRGLDISKEDLSWLEDFNELGFDTNTKWPEKVPAGFDPEQILELGKNPGLGIRDLHEQGITGKGVSIAIIDQALLLEHEEYKDNIVLYERIHDVDEWASMHGPAVASIAVGKNVGVAPEAKLYFIAETFGHFQDDGYEFDASLIADGIMRVLEINKILPEGEKIRVISISRGYNINDTGYQEITAAIEAAAKENVFVITTSTGEYYDFDLFGMSRDFLKDPEDFNSYTPAAWVKDYFYENPSAFQDMILFPMGSRAYAGFTGTEEYSIETPGGLSWSVPWCAGFYALCCQVKPDLTPQEFIQALKETGVTTELKREGKTYPFGKIVNPAEVIKALQNQ